MTRDVQARMNTFMLDTMETAKSTAAADGDNSSKRKGTILRLVYVTETL